MELEIWAPENYREIQSYPANLIVGRGSKRKHSTGSNPDRLSKAPKVEGQDIHGNTTPEPTPIEVPMELNPEFPLAEQEDFSNYSLPDYLNFLDSSLESLEYSPHFGVLTSLLQQFNSLHELQAERMRDMDECGHPVILRLLQILKGLESSDSAVTQEFRVEGFCFLGLLARNNKGRDIINQAEGLKLIVSAIEASSRFQSLELLRSSCFCFGNLISCVVDPDDSFHQLIRNHNVIEVITDAMKENLNQKKLLQVGLFALGNLARVDYFEDKIVSCEGIRLAFEAIRLYPQSSFVADCLFLFRNMVFGEKGCDEIIHNYGIEWITPLIQRFQCDPQILQLCIGFVLDLTFTCPMESLVKACGKAILTVIQQHIHNFDLLRETLKTLSRLYFNSDSESQVLLVRWGFIDLLRAGRIHYPGTKQIWNIASKISKKKISYSSVPTATPTMKECAARSLSKNPPAGLQHYLCEDLVDYLSKAKRCTGCGGCYVDFYFEHMKEHFYPEFDGLYALPCLDVLCGSKCFEQAKSQSNVPLYTQQIQPEVDEPMHYNPQ